MVISNQSSLVGSTSTYDPTLIPSSRRSAVLSSLSRFRSRLGTEMNEIIPNLYLGSLRDAVDEAQLRKNEIQYVVSVHDLSTQHPAHEQLKVLRIKLSDCPSVDISAHFAATNQFIHSARLEQAAVLVHCLAGISRSAAVVAAYLITVCDLSFFNALTFISRKRPVINPNFGFRMQLCTFADRFSLLERKRLRQYFGNKVFDSQFVVDRATVRLKSELHSIVPASTHQSTNTSSFVGDGTLPRRKSVGPRVTSHDSSKMTSSHDRESSISAGTKLPGSKTFSQISCPPNSEMTELSQTLVHSPNVPEIRYIDE